MRRLSDALALAVALPLLALFLPLILLMERFADPAVPEWAWHMHEEGRWS